MYSAKVPRPPVCLTEPKIPKSGSPSWPGPRGDVDQLMEGERRTYLFDRGWEGVMTSPTASAPRMEGDEGVEKIVPG